MVSNLKKSWQITFCGDGFWSVANYSKTGRINAAKNQEVDNAPKKNSRQLPAVFHE
jgi:hypothetical protein